MKNTSEEPFEQSCRNFLDEILAKYGFVYHGTYNRPCGIAVEYTGPSDYVFAVCEGNVLYVDLIHHSEKHGCLRISLNQVLWFSGVRTLVVRRPCIEQLGIFAAELRNRLASIMSGDFEAPDPRCMFPMTTTSRDWYLRGQRGEK